MVGVREGVQRRRDNGVQENDGLDGKGVGVEGYLPFHNSFIIIPCNKKLLLFLIAITLASVSNT